MKYLASACRIDEHPAASRPPPRVAPAPVLHPVVATAASALRVVVTEWCRAWRGDAPQPITPRVLDLGEQRHLVHLLTMLGNGEFDDVCFEGASADALAAIEDALTGAGGAVLVNPVLAAASPLYRPGYRVFAQAGAGRFFVSAAPRPELFADNDLSAYAAGFTPA